MKSFTPAVRRTEPIEFEIAGDLFHFTPPKVAAVTLAVMDRVGTDEFELEALRLFMDWLGAGLPEPESDKLIARLKDPSDDLDLDTLSEVVTWLMGQVAGRPTQPSSG